MVHRASINARTRLPILLSEKTEENRTAGPRRRRIGYFRSRERRDRSDTVVARSRDPHFSRRILSVWRFAKGALKI